MARYLYSELAGMVEARRNCAQRTETAQESNVGASVEWFDRHTETIESLVKQHMPHGSGFDSGTTLDLDASHADKLVFNTAFHHMNDGGYYDGWTEHTVTVTPALHGDFHLRISGRNRNDIKEMMYQDFDYLLRTDVTYDLFIGRYPELKITSSWECSDNRETLVFTASDGTRFTASDCNATNTYAGSPLDRARAYAATQMESKLYAR
jgi:hypothetical protein